jgi:hypothetical protein
MPRCIMPDDVDQLRCPDRSGCLMADANHCGYRPVQFIAEASQRPGAPARHHLRPSKRMPRRYIRRGLSGDTSNSRHCGSREDDLGAGCWASGRMGGSRRAAAQWSGETLDSVACPGAAIPARNVLPGSLRASRIKLPRSGPGIARLASRRAAVAASHCGPRCRQVDSRLAFGLNRSA